MNSPTKSLFSQTLFYVMNNDVGVFDSTKLLIHCSMIWPIGKVLMYVCIML